MGRSMEGERHLLSGVTARRDGTEFRDGAKTPRNGNG